MVPSGHQRSPRIVRHGRDSYRGDGPSDVATKDHPRTLALPPARLARVSEGAAVARFDGPERLRPAGRLAATGRVLTAVGLAQRLVKPLDAAVRSSPPAPCGRRPPSAALSSALAIGAAYARPIATESRSRLSARDVRSRAGAALLREQGNGGAPERAAGLRSCTDSLTKPGPGHVACEQPYA